MNARAERIESFHIDRGGMLVRSVTPAYGPKRVPYEHRCSQASFEAVAHAIDEIGHAGFGLDELVQRAEVPHTQAAVALALLKERGCVITENKRNYPATSDVYLDGWSSGMPCARSPLPAPTPVDLPQIPTSDAPTGASFSGDGVPANLPRTPTGTWAGKKWHGIYPTKGPKCESYANLAYVTTTQRTIAFGGLSLCGETWEWNAMREQWNQIADTGPSARSSAAMCYDENRQVIVLFGGNEGNQWPRDTWELDVDSVVWTMRDEQGPAGIGAHRMVYDRKHKRSLLYLPQYGHSETWSWDGNLWSRLNATPPLPRIGCNLVYDSDNNRPLLFGGRGMADGGDGYLHNDIWMLIADPAVRAQPVDYWVAPSQSARFVCDVRGSQPMSLHWQKNGIPLNDDGRITGSQTTSLVIHDVTVADEGSYGLVMQFVWRYDKRRRKLGCCHSWRRNE